MIKLTDCALAGVVVAAEGVDGGGIVRVDFEDVEQADELKSLDDELAGIHQLDGPALLFGGGLRADEGADAARVHAVHFGQVNDDLGTTVAQDLIHRAAEGFNRRAQAECPAQLENVDVCMFMNVDIQGSPPETLGVQIH